MYWIKKYKAKNLPPDLLAGFVLGVVLVPQSVAYAGIAGLPAIYGLYTAIVPLFIYALVGQNHRLGAGPAAMDSLLLAAAVVGLGGLGQNYLAIALALTFLVGLWQLLLAVFRFGFLVNFLSKPLINGFTTAVAILIILSQIPTILGGANAGNTLPKMLAHTIMDVVPNTSFTDCLFGIVGMALLIIGRRFRKFKAASVLVVVLLSCLLVYTLGLNQELIVVGAVPSKLPTLSWEFFDVIEKQFWQLLFVAAPLALIAFMEVSSINKALQKSNDCELDEEPLNIEPNRELFAFGAANFIGSLFGAFVASGSFSRSALNKTLGGKSNLSGMIAATTVGLVLLFFHSVFLHLPKSILAAIIIVASLSLIDTKYPVHLWRTKRDECYLLILSFVITLGFGVLEGLALGILVSLGLLVYRTTKPHYAVLGRVPGTEEYRNIARFRDLETRPDVVAIRFDAALYYANIDYCIQTMQDLMNKKVEARLLVLHCGGIHSLDATALEELTDFINGLNQKETYVYFAGLIGPIRDYMKRVGFFQKIGADHFFLDVQAAVDYFDKGKLDPKLSSRSRQSNR